VGAEGANVVAPSRRVARDRRRRAKRLAALVACALFAALYVGPVRSYLEAREQAAVLRHEVRSLERDTAALRARVRALRSDAAAEALARENGYIYPGETPYVVHLP
jgi:cell division protein FtsB